jgi:predicted O-methyltransferase YrrM
VNDALLVLLEKLAKFGQDNDPHQAEHSQRMLNITHDTGRLLWILVQAIGATRILEIGTSNAFSTIWLADAARSVGGRVTTLELNSQKIALARANLATASLDGVVGIIEGRALDTLDSLPGPFDLVFLDADRSTYLAYLELLIPKLRTGGLLIVDNATSHAHDLQEFLRRVKSHPQLFAVTVPIGNGEEIAIKLGNVK